MSVTVIKTQGKQVSVNMCTRELTLENEQREQERLPREVMLQLSSNSRRCLFTKGCLSSGAGGTQGQQRGCSGRGSAVGSALSF